MDVKQIQEIYDEISADAFLIELDPDPQGRGPNYLQEKVYECRKRLNRVSFIFSRVNQEQHALASELRAEEAVFAAESDELLANDERIRRMPSIEDRRALINVELRERYQTIDGLKAQILDLSHVEKVVKHRHQELKSSMTDIRTQRSLIKDSLATGAFYGSEDTGSESPGIGVDDEQEESYVALLDSFGEDADEFSLEGDESEVGADGEFIVEDDEDETTEEDGTSEAEVDPEEDDSVGLGDETPQDVVVSEGADPNASDPSPEEDEIERFLDDEDEELDAILDQI